MTSYHDRARVLLQGVNRELLNITAQLQINTEHFDPAANFAAQLKPLRRDQTNPIDLAALDAAQVFPAESVPMALMGTPAFMQKITETVGATSVTLSTDFENLVSQMAQNSRGKLDSADEFDTYKVRLVVIIGENSYKTYTLHELKLQDIFESSALTRIKNNVTWTPIVSEAT